MNTLSPPQLNMSMSCDSEVSVQNENALRFWIFSKPPPIIEYVKAISAIVGASHILEVFEENESIKVFFDDRRFTDTIIKTGIHVLGYHIRADYVIPPGIKVVLSNIDPVISNFDVLRRLSVYGKIVSPVVRPSICDDVEFCHIGYGVRYVYMVLEGVLPSRLEVKYGDNLSIVKIKIEDNTSNFPIIKLNRLEPNVEENNMNVSPYKSVPGPSRQMNVSPYKSDLAPSQHVFKDAENSDVPVLVSVHSAASETHSDDHARQLRKAPSETKSPVQQVVKNTIRRMALYPKSLHLKHKRMTSATKAANKITRNVKRNWGPRTVGGLKKGRRGRKPLRMLFSRPVTPSSSSDEDDKPSKSLLKNFKGPLNDKSLVEFLEEVKHRRAPLDVVKQYLGQDCDASKVNQLIIQLRHYSRKHNKQNLKLRIARLIKSLREGAQAAV